MTQQYVGTKIITAHPQVGLNDAPGYSVKYEDGYTSWSPKDTFEKAYLPLGNIFHLPPHQQRVIAEHAELRNKLVKLQDFTNTEAFQNLLEIEKDALNEQAIAMGDYMQVLEQRIARFEHDNGRPQQTVGI